MGVLVERWPAPLLGHCHAGRQGQRPGRAGASSLAL